MNKGIKELCVSNQVGGHWSGLPILRNYFIEIYGLTLDIPELKFYEHDRFSEYMVVPPSLSEEQILKALSERFEAGVDLALEQAMSGRSTSVPEQKRPNGLYIFAHGGTDTPDVAHLGKSYLDASSLKFPFANVKEYFLMTGFHRFTRGYFMDKRGGTITSSLAPDRYPLLGQFTNWPTLNELCLEDLASVEFRKSSMGPRELFLLP